MHHCVSGIDTNSFVCFKLSQRINLRLKLTESLKEKLPPHPAKSSRLWQLLKLSDCPGYTWIGSKEYRGSFEAPFKLKLVGGTCWESCRIENLKNKYNEFGENFLVSSYILA